MAEISYNISVTELREYWAKVHNLAVGEWIGVYPRECMPTWAALCDELPWEIYTLDGGYFPEKHHGFQGVYRLFALDKPGVLQSATTFRRLARDDPTGTLYIGEAGNLCRRLNQARADLRAIIVVKTPTAPLVQCGRFQSLTSPSRRLG
ncbi:hypothetical protein ABIF07_003586 [Bradyrhizobium elkanii]|uniref:hypothetical protein n=1 Tax=Bradyrhizobium elkanii TaxID=29448 RepID=UPI002167C9AD|nr:hypothetical protein [Bradyrhizobium elkanii]MCS3689389.1 hypothetical protein [Bradyrhizobium elkanii]